MKSLFIVASVSVLFVITVFNTDFQKAIGSSDSVDKGQLVLQTNNGYVVLGEKLIGNADQREILIYKVDLNGTLMWSKTYSGSYAYVVNDGYVDSNQNIHLSAERYINNKETLLYMEIDSSGNLLESVPYDENNNEVEPWAIAEAPNGESIVVGFTKLATSVPVSFYNGSLEIKYLYVVKIDASGERIWSKRLNTPQGFESNAYDIVKLPNDEYMILGQLMDVAQEKIVNVLYKVNGTGDILFGKALNVDNAIFRYLDILPSGDLMASGFCLDSYGKMDVLAARITTSGNVLWSKQYGTEGNEKCYGVTSKGNEIILACSSDQFGSDSEQIIMLNIDETGIINWSNKYGMGVLDNPSKPIMDGNSIVSSGFALRAPNGKETIIFRIPNVNNITKEVSFNSNNLTINFTNNSYELIDLNNPRFGGSYTISDTEVTDITLNVDDINL